MRAQCNITGQCRGQARLGVPAVRQERRRKDFVQRDARDRECDLQNGSATLFLHNHALSKSY